MTAAGTSRRRRKLGLSARFSLFVALCLGLVCIQGLSLVGIASRAGVQAQAERIAGDLAGYAAARSSAAFLWGERDGLEAALRPLLELPHVSGVAAYDAKGGLLWSAGYAPSNRSRAMAEGVVSGASGFAAVAEHELRAAAAMAKVAGAPSGAVVVWVDSEALAVRQDGVLRVAMALFGLTILLALGLAVFAARRLTAPLRALTAFADNANETGLDKQLEMRTGDEFEALANAFNAMLARLDASMRRVRKLAYVDPVTELPNAERFLRDLRERLPEIAREGEEGRGAVILLSLTRLNQFADSFGQDAAQELLALAAQRLAGSLHTADRIVRRERSLDRPSLCARVSAGEFAVLAPCISGPEDAGRLAQMLVSALAQPLEWRGQQAHLAPASGVAMISPQTVDADGAVRQARLAVRAARHESSPVRFFTHALDRDANARIILEREMREGLERHQFRAYFQPKVDLETGRICGAEALARWVRPDGKRVGPAEFIPAAEENGLISKIAEIIMRDAAWKAAAWAREGCALKVAVNVSALQFGDDRFAARAIAALDQAGLPPELLELEITESVAMTNVDRVLQLIEPLRARGVSFAIDDFGTGHSSLAALTRLPFDVIKIDQQFVRGLKQDRHAPAIVETILAMAASLNFDTVAEGVETEEEASFLRLRGCRIGQGFLYGAPVAPVDFLERVRQERDLRAARAARAAVA